MRLNCILVSAATLLVASSSFADLKSDWQKKMDSYCAAVMRKDNKAATKVIKDNFSTDFKFIPLKGKSINLTEWLAQGEAEFKMSEKVMVMSIKIDSIKMGKDSAMMTTTVKFEGLVKMDPKAKAGTMKVVSMADQTVVKRGGKWWLTEIKQKTEKATLNGKPMTGM